MLVWAGLVEAFFSQYHAPVLPYELKIGFGVLELLSACPMFWRWPVAQRLWWQRTVARRNLKARSEHP
jgi:hypothetical protein